MILKKRGKILEKKSRGSSTTILSILMLDILHSYYVEVMKDDRNNITSLHFID